MLLFSPLLGVGALTGLILVSWKAPQKERLRYLDAAILTLIGALIGSRLVSAAVNWAYYASHLVEIFQVWKGGLSSIGAIIGGCLTIIIVSLVWRIPLGALADTLLPLAGTITVAAWMGCWFGGCSYGGSAEAWWALPARDEWGVMANRVPVQLIGAVLTLVIIWLVDTVTQRLPVRGMGAAIGILGISAVLFGLSYLRIDPTPIWRGLRLEAWGALLLMIFSSVTLVVLLAYRILTEKQNFRRRQTASQGGKA
jgi:phosphatidylglycerol:prolipoprotein diacylglycerol transferase